MAAEAKITVEIRPDGSRIVTDESGVAYTWPARGDYPRLDLDPRIDLTKPIWEQAVNLRAKDAAAATKRARRKVAAA